MAVNEVGQRIQRLDTLELTWLGVVQKLESLFSKDSGVCGRNIQVIPAPDVDDVELLEQAKGGPLELPVIVVAPSQVEPDVGSYNGHIMRRVGSARTISDDRSNWMVLRVSPVLLTFQVTLITDDVITMIRMISRWTSNETWGFKLTDPVGIDIQILADKTLAVPPRTTTSGGGRQFRLSTTVRAKTYSGFLWFVPAIRRLELTTIFPTEGSIAEALAAGVLDETIVSVRSISADPPEPLSEPVYEPEA